MLIGKIIRILPRNDKFVQSCRDSEVIADNFPTEHDLETVITITRENSSISSIILVLRMQFPVIATQIELFG